MIKNYPKLNNLKNKELLTIIIGICFIIGIILFFHSDYTNMCKKLMIENKEVVNQLNTLDPNSAEWNNLETQTENENPQLIECIYPSNNND